MSNISAATHGAETLNLNAQPPIEGNLDTENARLHGRWDERMKDKGGNGRPHDKTEVLLISWHDSIDELKVGTEVQELANTFESAYKYTVTRQYIMPDRLAQVQISKYLADFVYENDSDKTLLIIYYAGHGIAGKPGQLALTSDTRQQIEDQNSIMWDEAEHMIKVTRADVFVIFDCCYAGNLARGGRGQSTRNFEFMGASNWSSITRIPGKDSFTSALIWALERFAEAGVPFTTTQLQMKIGNEAPHFPRHQFPILTSRGDGTCDRRLVLDINRQDIKPPKADKEPVNIQEVVDLRICFEQHPENSDIDNLSDALRDLIETKRLKAHGIQWRGLRENPTPENLANENLVHHVAFQWRRTIRSKKAKSLPVLTIPTIQPVQLGDSLSTPSPSSVGDHEHLTSDLLRTRNGPEFVQLGNSLPTPSPSSVGDSEYLKSDLLGARNSSGPIQLGNSTPNPSPGSVKVPEHLESDFLDARNSFDLSILSAIIEYIGRWVSLQKARFI